ncbi:MAG: fatty acid desaturase [Actinomycetota bacterium]
MSATTRDYSLTGPESQRAIEAGLADAEWYRSPVDPAVMAELNQRTDLRAGLDVVLWAALLVGAGVWAFVSLGSWWAVPAFVVYGALYGGAADARWHECGHGTAFRSDRLNALIYHPASFMLLREPTVWRWSHVRHHSDTIVVGRDNEIVFPRPIDVRSWSLNLVGVLGVPAAIRRIVRHARGRLDADVADYVPVADHRRVVVEARVFLAVIVGVVALCVVVLSPVPLLFVVGPTFYGSWLMAFFGTTQHAGLREDVLDHRLNTRTVYMNPIFRFLYLNMNYHVEHHMFPTVPYRNLPALHAAIADDLPAPSPSTWAAYREIWTAVRGQRADVDFELERAIPESSPTPTAVVSEVGTGWVSVCEDEELAVGTLRTVDGPEGPVVVCRGGDGSVHALAGTCTHSARGVLGDGVVIGDEIECPKHNGRFRLSDGCATRAPATKPLGVHEVRIAAGRIQVRL